MRSRVDACGGLVLACGVGDLRRGRLCIRGESRTAFGWVDCHMGLSGGRPFRDPRVGGLVSGGEWCRMGRLIRFHRGDGLEGAGGMLDIDSRLHFLEGFRVISYLAERGEGLVRVSG